MQAALRISGFKLAFAAFVCALALWYALPNLASREQLADIAEFLPEERLNLGLDLLGGSHLLLQVDTKGYMREQMDSLRGSIRAAVRERGIGYSELAVRGSSVVVALREDTLPEDFNARAVFAQSASGIDVEETEPHRYRIRYTKAQQRGMLSELTRQTVEILARRIDETGTREPVIQQQGEDRILLQVPGLEDPAQLKTILGTTAKMNFHLVNHKVTQDQLYRGEVPLDTMIVPSKGRDGEPAQPYALYAAPAIHGEALVDANATLQQGEHVVAFRFDNQGARLFGDITRKHVGDQFAVVLDGEVITAPVIRSAILGGSGIIEGNFTQQSAANLALLLRSGALPADVSILEERSVGPSLGADSIEAGTIAALLSIGLVAMFMVLAYGLFGVFSVVALALNMALLVGALSALQATLTLPGIAGIVLTLGMAVDANVLIFERIREEMRVGNSVRASIERGFSGAFSTILDSNITTLIAAFVLFYFGSGTVKGFAVTLAFGIISSMFSAIFLTRIMVVAWLSGKARTTLAM